MFSKSTPMRSKKHLDFVRSKPCVKCGANNGIDAHHLIALGNGGTGTKESDGLTIPLCRSCHSECHASPRVFDQPFYFIKFIRAAFNNGDLVHV